MRIIVKSKNLELTEALHIWIERQVESLKHYLEGFEEQTEFKKQKLELQIEVGKESRHHKKGDVFFAEFTLFLPGGNLRAKKFGSDLRAVIDEAKEDLERSIRKYKNRRIFFLRKKAREFKLKEKISEILQKPKRFSLKKFFRKK